MNAYRIKYKWRGNLCSGVYSGNTEADAIKSLLKDGSSIEVLSVRKTKSMTAVDRPDLGRAFK